MATLSSAFRELDDGLERWNKLLFLSLLVYNLLMRGSSSLISDVISRHQDHATPSSPLLHNIITPCRHHPIEHSNVISG